MAKQPEQVHLTSGWYRDEARVLYYVFPVAIDDDTDTPWVYFLSYENIRHPRCRARRQFRFMKLIEEKKLIHLPKVPPEVRYNGGKKKFDRKI